MVVDILHTLYIEALRRARAEGQKDVVEVRVVGDGGAERKDICGGDAVVGGSAVGVVVGHPLGQGPASAVVTGVVDVVLAGAAAVPRREGNMQIAAVVGAVLHHG